MNLMDVKLKDSNSHGEMLMQSCNMLNIYCDQCCSSLKGSCT